MITAKGHTGQVTFDGQFITIIRKGALARMSVGKGEKRIPIGSVTAVQWKPPGGLVNGFIQFSIGGGNERRSRFGRQTTSAVGDENSVVVLKKQTADFERLRAAIEVAIAQRASPQAAAPAPAQASRLEQLQQLRDLRDSGVLSVDEFEAEKARIMSAGTSEDSAPGPAPEYPG